MSAVGADVLRSEKAIRHVSIRENNFWFSVGSPISHHCSDLRVDRIAVLRDTVGSAQKDSGHNDSDVWNRIIEGIEQGVIAGPKSWNIVALEAIISTTIKDNDVRLVLRG